MESGSGAVLVAVVLAGLGVLVGGCDSSQDSDNGAEATVLQRQLEGVWVAHGDRWQPGDPRPCWRFTLRAAGSGEIRLTGKGIETPYVRNSVKWDPLREYTVLESDKGKGVIRLEMGPQAAPRLLTVLLSGEYLFLNGDRYWRLH